MIALLVATIWGLNFVMIQVALRTIPPLFLTVLRFALAAFPAIFFVRRPKIPVSTLALYGLSIFAVQFGCLFSGMKAGVPAGVASLVAQVQVFFTMGLSMWAFRDRPQPFRWIGALVAFGGVGVVAMHAHGDVSPFGLALVLAGALAWGVGNVTAKRAGAVNPFALVVWGSAIAVPPLLALSVAVEGLGPIGASFANLSLGLVGAVVYISHASTLLAFSLWSYLMRRYPPSVVAPFSLLVPVAGFLGSVLFLGESLPAWKLGAAALVIAGLGLNVFGARLIDALWRPAAEIGGS